MLSNARTLSSVTSPRRTSGAPIGNGGTVVDSIIKNLPAFGALTEAEARVFEEAAESRDFAAGSEVPAADSLLLVTDGVLQFGIESSGSYQSPRYFGTRRSPWRDEPVRGGFGAHPG